MGSSTMIMRGIVEKSRRYDKALLHPVGVSLDQFSRPVLQREHLQNIFSPFPEETVSHAEEIRREPHELHSP